MWLGAGGPMRALQEARGTSASCGLELARHRSGRCRCSDVNQACGIVCTV